MAIAKAALLLAVLTSPAWAGTDGWALPPRTACGHHLDR